jgi:hypothetical protein
MDEELRRRLEEQSKKIDDIFRSVERTRKYFLWTLIISVVLFILPLIGLLFAIPQFLSIYSGGLGI